MIRRVVRFGVMHVTLQFVRHALDYPQPGLIQSAGAHPKIG
jgi:hypothetical protein